MRLPLLGSLVLLTTVLTPLGAQPTARRQGPQVVRATGLVPARDTMRRIGRLRAERITAVDIAALHIFEGLTATSTFVLQPLTPVVANRGSLAFTRSSVYPSSGLGPGGHAVTYKGDDGSYMTINVYGSPGKTYVIDVVVEAHCYRGGVCDPSPLEFTTEQGPDQPFVPNADGHALFAFTATQAGWHHVSIRAVAPDDYFTFYSATISVLQ
jgi:hypothetical protein